MNCSADDECVFAFDRNHREDLVVGRRRERQDVASHQIDGRQVEPRHSPGGVGPTADDDRAVCGNLQCVGVGAADQAGIPRGEGAARRVRRDDSRSRLTASLAESTAQIDQTTRSRERVHSADRRGPRREGASHRIERGGVVAWRRARDGEIATRVQGPAREEKLVDVVGNGRRGEAPNDSTGGRIDGGQPRACDTPDGAETSASVHGGRVNGEGVDLIVGAGIPREQRAGGGVERGQSIARLPGDLGKASPDDDLTTRNSDGEYRVVGVGDKGAQSARHRIDRDQSLPGLRTEKREITADPQVTTRKREGANEAGIGDERRHELPVAVQATEVWLANASNAIEAAAQVVPTATIRNHRHDITADDDWETAWYHLSRSSD